MNTTASTLLTDLGRFRNHFERRVGPAVTALINSAMGELDCHIAQVIAVGKPFPSRSSLVDTEGKKYNLSKVLETQRTVVVFYRGSWCPYCLLTLRAFQEAYATFKEAGTSLVAISPELPEYGAKAVDQHDLKFTVLSDRKGVLIRALGLNYELPERLHRVFESDGLSIPMRNGSDDRLLPLTSAFIVEPPGIIRDRFVSPDFTKRTELAAALEAVSR